jgi:hypothetical protein
MATGAQGWTVIIFSHNIGTVVVIEAWINFGGARAPKRQALPMLLRVRVLFEWLLTGPTAIHDCGQECRQLRRFRSKPTQLETQALPDFSSKPSMCTYFPGLSRFSHRANSMPGEENNMKHFCATKLSHHSNKHKMQSLL